MSSKCTIFPPPPILTLAASPISAPAIFPPYYIITFPPIIWGKNSGRKIQTNVNIYVCTYGEYIGYQIIWYNYVWNGVHNIIIRFASWMKLL